MRNYGSYAQAPPKFIAGARCLDFLNTTEDGGVERLTSYAEFVIWSKAAGLIDAAGQRRLLALAAKQPRAAAKTLALVLKARGGAGRFVQGFGAATDSGGGGDQRSAGAGPLRHAARVGKGGTTPALEAGWSGTSATAFEPAAGSGRAALRAGAGADPSLRRR